MPDWMIPVAIQLVGLAALGGAVLWRVGRLERDVLARATVERVDALEKRMSDKGDGVEKKLDKLELILEDIRRTTTTSRPAPRRR